jgi:transcriptional regulator with XRE-family HTH domain
MTEKFLSTRIKAAREAKGLSQGGLAEGLGISRSAVNQWEVGRTAPSGENIRQLAEFLGETVEWLSTGRGRANFDKSSDLIVSPPPPASGDLNLRIAILCEYMATQIYHMRQSLDRIERHLTGANDSKE